MQIRSRRGDIAISVITKAALVQCWGCYHDRPNNIPVYNIITYVVVPLYSRTYDTLGDSTDAVSAEHVP